jgi:hypothetical protein
LNYAASSLFDDNPMPSGWFVAGDNFGSSSFSMIGFQFTTPVTAEFTFARLGVQGINLNFNFARVTLQEDNNGVPGLVLDDTQIQNLTTTPTLYTASAVNAPVLQAGAPYWLVLSAPFSTSLTWKQNTIGDASNGSNFVSTSQPFNPTGDVTGPWNIQPCCSIRGAFEINGTPIPEPSSWLLSSAILSATSMLGRRRQRDRKQD